MKGSFKFMNSKVCYGKTLLEAKDVKDTNIKNRIELEYYRIKKKRHHFLRDNTESYGIEVVKKEYQGKRINVEKEKIDKISNKKANIDSILNTLRKFKVTPIALKDVIEDMTHS